MAVLSATERRTLQSVCTAFLPILAPQEGDDPRLFALDATALGLAEAMEEAIGALGAGKQAELRRLLGRLLEPCRSMIYTLLAANSNSTPIRLLFLVLARWPRYHGAENSPPNPRR